MIFLTSSEKRKCAVANQEKQMRIMIFCSGYETDEDCNERLKELQTGEIELSRRRGVPLDVDVE